MSSVTSQLIPSLFSPSAKVASVLNQIHIDEIKDWSDFFGNCIVHVAVSCEPSQLQELLTHIREVAGASDLEALLAVQNAEGRNPLDVAVYQGRTRVARMLHEAKAVLSIAPLQQAILACSYVQTNDMDSLRTFMEIGGSGRAGDWDRRTPLHIAAADGKLEAVRVLMLHGASPDAPDRWAITPMQEALRAGNAEVVEALREGGAGHSGEATLSDVVRMPELRLVVLRELPIILAEGEWDMVEVLMSTPDGTACVYTEDLWYASLDTLSRGCIDYRRAVESSLLEMNNLSNSIAVSCFRSGKPIVVGPSLDADMSSVFHHEELLAAGFSFGAIIPVVYLDRVVAIVQCFGSDTSRIPSLRAVATKTQDSLTQVVFSELPRTLTGHMSQLTRANADAASTARLSGSDDSADYGEAPGTPQTLTSMMRTRSLRLKAGAPKPGSTYEDRRRAALAAAEHAVASLPSAPATPHTAMVTAANLPASRLKHMNAVYQIVAREGIFNTRHVYEEVLWYYTGLGMDTYYFDHFDATSVARHIHAFMAAKEEAVVTGERERVFLVNEGEHEAFYACPDDAEHVLATEKRIEQTWFGMGYHSSQQQTSTGSRAAAAAAAAAPSGPVDGTATPMAPGRKSSAASLRSSLQLAQSPPESVQSSEFGGANYFATSGRSLRFFRTRGTASRDGTTRLCLYFLSCAPFVNPDPSEEESTDIWEVSTGEFLRDKPKKIRDLYADVVERATKQLNPVFRVTRVEKTGQSRVIIAFKRGTTHSFFSSCSDLISRDGFTCNRKFVERFSNGVDVHSLYLGEAEEHLAGLLRKIGLFYVLPRTTLSPLFSQGVMTAEVVSYAYAAWKFVFYFAARPGDDLAALSRALAHDPTNRSRLMELGANLRRDVFTEQRVAETIFQYPGLVSEIYEDFEAAHNFARGAGQTRRSTVQTQEHLHTMIRKQIADEVDAEVLFTMLLFNRATQKTNFFMRGKTALAFRLDVSFFGNRERYAAYPDIPFGVFMLVGSTFRGFHVRFKDVARGGIRIIKSHDPNAFNRNKEALFVENYNLARTQMRKNKDIPEGGSKGTILISLGHADKARDAFCMYIDALLSVSMMAPAEMIDYKAQREMLFLGPDEGTAEYMDWAALYAREAGYEHWKAFTTGKSPSLGGIPHDSYGMTTRSVHQYVLGCLRKLGMNESEVTKFQTGGPDGDLGSNEILISNDRTVGIVDGSGVLYDRNGIDRDELARLAKQRRMVENFNRGRLSNEGFLITINETDVSLPIVGHVESGLHFRNSFHLHPLASADVFVPCGGRPEAVNVRNVDQLLDDAGVPKFRIIVEGANLFFTQEARAFLEERDVVLYKDASANKGGVTSSSLEVLAALSMDDATFGKHMQVDVESQETPVFYQDFVREVQHIIEENARLEFECIWAEVERAAATEEPKRYRSELTDVLSKRINMLTEQIEQSALWDTTETRNAVLARALPQTLLDLVGFDGIMDRVPESYLRAIFGSYLASRFVYTGGLSATALDFYTFMGRFGKEQLDGVIE